MAKIKDVYDQFLYMSVTQSGTNALTFGKLAIGVSIFDYAALIISRIEYDISRAALAEILAATDEINLAICGSNTITALTLEQPEVYDIVRFKGWASGTPATADAKIFPVIHDFSNMKGGGILIPAQDVYIAMDSDGLTGAQAGNARVYYRIISLGAMDYIELVQRLRVLTT